MLHTCTTPPTFDTIREAEQRIRDHIIRTPVLESSLLNEKTGGRLFLKAEVLQNTGSFKYRGAMNFISQLTESERQNGVVAFSSGNHAQAVAAAASYFQIPSVIVMPADAPKIKMENTKAYGAEVVLYDRYTQSREKIAAEIATTRNASIIPPYDHPWTIAGQGTAGLELIQQTQAQGIDLDAVLIPCSGGGLSSGCALAIKALSPHTKVYTVEPEGFDDTALSLQAGKRVSIDINQKSMCDALLLPQPGEITFPLLMSSIEKGLSVTDKEVGLAMKNAFELLKVVVEPGGAVALAAVLAGKIDNHGKNIGIILSGGNVEPSLFYEAINL